AAKPEVCRAIALVVEAFRAGGRLFYVGAGTSGRLGMIDAAECPPTFLSDPTMVQGIIAGGREAMFASVESAEDEPAAGTPPDTGQDNPAPAADPATESAAADTQRSDEDRGPGGEETLPPLSGEISNIDSFELGRANVDGAGSMNGSEPAGSAVDSVPSDQEAVAPSREVDVNWEEFYEGAENATHIREPVQEEHDFTEYTAAGQSLYEKLLWQLRLCSLDGTDAEIGEYLIGCIDDDGFLSEDCLPEAALEFKVEVARVERVLSILQEFEPLGVAARSSAECLLIQMKELGSYSEVARVILSDHFEALQRKKFREIARAIRVAEKQVLEVYHQVSRLEPKPGRCFSKESVLYINPDVHVELIDGERMIYLNEGTSRHLSINRLYRRMLRTQGMALTKEDKAYAEEKFRGALMLIKNIEKRKSTILRVTEAIMDVQSEFLIKGVEVLRPLTLREVADQIGMHESTVARVISRKYVDTPQGLYRLKYFFSSGIESTAMPGLTVSSRSIKKKLTDLISEEDPKRPLSDQKIAETLNQEGFRIARRTVAKYREQLRILPAKLRRET
ncbi:RNA polymerase factor sigma-54, partial [Candidatus Sumerlaeota bacterium]|nr:RNA polymerase factor sigma-54 [Candidatus Sumerlaeota bacterium]